MRMTVLVVTALLAGGCGAGLSGAPATQGSALTASDGGNSQDDGGTEAQDAGASLADGGASDPGSCDCNGLALPDFCMVCTDGQTACAHFVCSEGMCEVQTCP